MSKEEDYIKSSLKNPNKNLVMFDFQNDIIYNKQLDKFYKKVYHTNHEGDFMLLSNVKRLRSKLNQLK